MSDVNALHALHLSPVCYADLLPTESAPIVGWAHDGYRPTNATFEWSTYGGSSHPSGCPQSLCSSRLLALKVIRNNAEEAAARHLQDLDLAIAEEEANPTPPVPSIFPPHS